MAVTDLTTLADCKAWLGLTSSTDDIVLATLISGVSAAVLADLGRTMVPQVVEETIESSGGTSLPLRQWPVSAIAAVTIDGVALAASTTPGTWGWRLEPPDPAPPGAMQRLHLVGSPFPRDGIVSVTYRAGYEILGEAATVPVVAPFVVTAQAPFGDWCLDTGVTGAPGPYTAAAGVYTFAPAAAGAAITLSYGYVPADLARACLEWVADRYAARGRIGLAAKTLGGQETTSFIVKAMPDIVDRLLQPYRRVAR